MIYIDIEKELIPYRFDISLADVLYTFEVHYNGSGDFFTINLERDGVLLIQGEKVVYGVILFQDVRDDRFPDVDIFPYDESGNAKDVTWETLSTSVFLYVFQREG